MTIYKPHEMADIAEKHDACDKALEYLRSLPEEVTFEELSDHEFAPEWARWWSRNIIRGRWIEAEPIIMKSPWASCRYATYILKGRWEEAEPVIMQDPWAAFSYATRVL